MNRSARLHNARQVALFFAAICCATTAVTIATPVLAADAKPMAETDALGIKESTPAPIPAPVADADAPAPQPKVEQDSFEAELQQKSEQLKPGGFVWRDSAAEVPGAVRLVVSISDQRAYVYRGETLVAVSTVSTGKPGHRTPTGTFPIMEKHAVHYSNKYDNAPMPHMQRLTNDGVALHAGRIPGHPASHGCVRLPARFAADLFKVTRRGTPVTITA